MEKVIIQRKSDKESACVREGEARSLPSYQTDCRGKQMNSLLIFLSENHKQNRERLRKPQISQILAQKLPSPGPIQAAQISVNASYF